MYIVPHGAAGGEVTGSAYAVPEFVVDVDIAARTVKMRPIAGMFDEPVNGDEE